MNESAPYQVLVHDDAKLAWFEHVEFLARMSPVAATKLYTSIEEIIYSNLLTPRLTQKTYRLTLPVAKWYIAFIL
jgi:hypothetical protein